MTVHRRYEASKTIELFKLEQHQNDPPLYNVCGARNAKEKLLLISASKQRVESSMDEIFLHASLKPFVSIHLSGFMNHDVVYTSECISCA